MTCATLLLTMRAFAQQSSSDGWAVRAAKTAESQLKFAARKYQPGLHPRSTNPDGSVRLADYKDWTTGFFPGSLWYGYELSGDKELRSQAQRFTLALDSVRYLKNTHDVGFMLFCSYGNAYRLTGDKIFLPALSDGAKNLAARFNAKVGAIKSWDFSWWHFPVIIDNMMNLEYLYWAGKQFGHQDYISVADKHALTTLKNHFRKDFSSYHVVDYDPSTGRVIRKATHQGLADESAWSRGQGWALYGFTMCYKNTHRQDFLRQARKIAEFIINHPGLQKDRIPAWDLDVHNAYDKDKDGEAPRDASAAAVIASALLELSTLVDDGQQYFSFAEEMLKTLSSEKYLAKPGENNLFILKHSVGALLYNSEIDTPLDYADYYYLEALKRYIDLKGK